MVAPKEIIYYKNLYDNEETREEIRRTLLSKGKFLIDSVTGSGKTFAIIKVMQELVKEHPNKVFIIACPNKIQNIQNGKEYKVTVIVGDENKKTSKSYDCLTVASMVYDKAVSILEDNNLLKKEITLVIDEAHQLIYSKNFRKKAINSVLNLEEKCFNVLHLSATTRSLIKAYNYDEVIVMKPGKGINNIKRLILMKSENKDISLLKSIDGVLKKESKVLLYLNNKNKIKEVLKLLESQYKDKVIKSLCRDENNNISDKSIFESITEKSLIPYDVDILIVTSFIECGTNIKNKDIVPIMYVDSNKNFNLDGCVQFFARPRNNVDIGFLIYQPSKKENEYISIDEVIKIESKYVKKTIKDLDVMFKSMANVVGIEQSILFIKGMLKEETIYDHSYGKGYIFLDEETLEFKCDRELFYKYCFDRHDPQLLEHDKKLISSLIGNIKTDDIKVMQYSKSNATKSELKEVETLTESIKQSKSELKEYRAELKNNLIKLSKDLNNKMIFTEYLLADEEVSRELYKEHAKEELRKNIEELEKDTKVLTEITKTLNKYKDTLKTIYTDEEVVTMYMSSEFQETILRGEQYRIWNNIIDKDLKTDTRYSIIRKLDSKIQKRLSKKEILNLYNELYPKNKKDKLTSKAEEKLIKEIELIYNLNKDSKGFVLSSLKK